MSQRGVGEEFVFQYSAPDLDDRDVGLLDAGRRVRWDADAVLAEVLKLSSGPSGQADDGQQAQDDQPQTSLMPSDSIG